MKVHVQIDGKEKIVDANDIKVNGVRLFDITQRLIKLENRVKASERDNERKLKRYQKASAKIIGGGQ